MPAHAAPKNPDRLANIVIATFVVLGITGVCVDAVARPRAGQSRRDDFMDDLVSDIENPERAVGKIAETFTPHHHHHAPIPAVTRATPHEPVRPPVKPGRHRKPGPPLKDRQGPLSDSDRHSYGRHHIGPRLRVPRSLSDRIRRLTEL